MAYSDYEDDDDVRTTDETMDLVRAHLSDIESRLKKINDSVEDSSAGIRLEIAQNRRELAEMRASMARLQGRFDNQLMTLVFSNVASSLGAVALVLGLSHAL